MNQQGDDGRWILGWSFGDNEALRKLQIKYEAYRTILMLEKLEKLDKFRMLEKEV